MFEILPLEIVEMIGYQLTDAKDYVNWISSSKSIYKELGGKNAINRFLSTRSLFFRGGVCDIFEGKKEKEKLQAFAKIEKIAQIVDQCNGVLRGRILTEEWLGKRVWSNSNYLLPHIFKEGFDIDIIRTNGFLFHLSFIIPCTHFQDFNEALLHETGYTHNPDIDFKCSLDKEDCGCFTWFPLPLTENISVRCLLNWKCGRSITQKNIVMFDRCFPKLYIDYTNQRWDVTNYKEKDWLDSWQWIVDADEDSDLNQEQQVYVLKIFLLYLCIIDHMYTINDKIDWCDPSLKSGFLIKNLIEIYTGDSFHIESVGGDDKLIGLHGKDIPQCSYKPSSSLFFHKFNELLRSIKD